MRYLSPAESAKFVRKALKENFPGVKFSVRSKSYSGGGSIRVDYTDGPLLEAVDKVVKPFEGATFDGMIDLKSYKENTVLTNEDGSTEEVHFGSDFIFVDRHMSEETKARIGAEFEKEFEKEGYKADDHTNLVPVSVHPSSEPGEWALNDHHKSYAPELIRRMFHKTDLYEKAS